MKRTCIASLLTAAAFAAQAQTIRQLPEAPPSVDSPASGAIILGPGLDQGAREKPREMMPPSKAILEPNASGGASSPEPALDPQSQNRPGVRDPRDQRNRRDDTGKRDNQDR